MVGAGGDAPESKKQQHICSVAVHRVAGKAVDSNRHRAAERCCSRRRGAGSQCSTQGHDTWLKSHNRKCRGASAQKVHGAQADEHKCSFARLGRTMVDSVLLTLFIVSTHRHLNPLGLHISGSTFQSFSSCWERKKVKKKEKKKDKKYKVKLHKVNGKFSIFLA